MAVQEKFDLVIRAQDEATATLRNVNREVDRLGGPSMTRLNAGLSSYNREVTKADIKTAALGGHIAGLNPQVASMANAFLFTSPALAAVSVGMGILVKAILDVGQNTNQAIAIIEKHKSALEDLANSNLREAETARALLAQRRASLQAELAQAQAQLAELQSSAISGIQTYLQLSNIFGPVLIKSTADGGAGVASLTAKIAELQKQLGMLSGQMYGPTRDDMERFIAQEKEAAKTAEMLNKALRQRDALLKGLQKGHLRGTGFDASLRGPGYFGVPQDEVDKAKQDAKDAMESIWAIPEEESRAIADAQAQWVEFSAMVLSSTDQLSSGITDMFFGLRESLTEVFKSMAAAWVRHFINEIIKQTALRLGFALFNAIFPGSGALVGSAPGFGDVPITGGLARISPSSGTGVDLAAAGAKRFAGSGAGPASVVVNINGDVIGEEQYVNKRIIPAIENAIRYQKTIIASR